MPEHVTEAATSLAPEDWFTRSFRRPAYIDHHDSSRLHIGRW